MFGNDNFSGGHPEFHIVDDKRFVLEETANQMKVLQYGVWANAGSEVDPSRAKWETRTYFIKKDGGEQAGKGCAFSLDGAHELARNLVAQGLGYTTDIIKELRNRDDFMPSLKRVLGNESEIDLSEVDDEYYDPSAILGEIEGD